MMVQLTNDRLVDASTMGKKSRRNRPGPAAQLARMQQASSSSTSAPRAQFSDIGADEFRASCQLEVASPSLETRKTLVDIVEAYTKLKKGGVIVVNESGNRFLAMEFYGPGRNAAGDPLIQVQYVCALERPRADNFLRGETVLTMSCTDEVTRSIEKHMLKHLKTRGLTDIGSGCQLYEGYFPPMRP